MKKWMPISLVLLLIAGTTAGCSGGEDSAEDRDTSGAETGQTADFSQTDADMFTERDCEGEYDESGAVHIELDGSSVSADSDSVDISGTTVTLTEEAVYIISGELDDGMIIVNAADDAKLQLVLDGADINSETCSPIYIAEADKVFVTLAEGTENTLSNGGTFTAVDDSNIDSVIFSRQDLTLNGGGSLTVTSPAGHGVVSNDDLVITGGSYTVSCASHALKANDSVRITGETYLSLYAGKDGIHAENDEDASLGFVYISNGSFEIEAEGDGLSAGAYMQITDGDFSILAGGGSENAASQSSDAWGEWGGSPGQPGGHGGQGGMRGGMEDGMQNGMENGMGGEMGGTDPGNPQDNTGAAESLSAVTSAGDTAADTENADDDSSTSMKGIKASGDMLISGGSFTIDSADDAVHSNAAVTVEDGTFEIASGDDAFHADDTLTAAGGTIHITQCYEGLEALHVKVQGGDITLTADDDGLNAAGGTDSSGTQGGRDGMFGGMGDGNMSGGDMGGDMGGGNRGGAGMGEGGMSSASNGSIEITGGTLYITASGDGIDANGSLTISGGYTIVTGPTQGDTATLDYDTTAVISGGVFIGTGASGMAQTFSDQEQGVISVSAGSQSAGTKITLTAQSGEEIISYTPELSFEVVILSSPDIVSGETYTLEVGDISGEVEAD